MTVFQYTTLNTIAERLVHEFGLGEVLTSCSGSTTELSDERLISTSAPDDYYRGAWIRISSQNTLNNQVRAISDYDKLSGTIYFHPPLSTPLNGNVEIWRLYNPTWFYHDIVAAARKITTRRLVPLTYDISIISSAVLREGVEYTIAAPFAAFNSETIGINDTYKSIYINKSFVNPGDYINGIGVWTFTPTTTMSNLVFVPQISEIFFIDKTSKTLTTNAFSAVHRSSIYKIYRYNYLSHKIGDDMYESWESNMDLTEVTGWSLINDNTILFDHNVDSIYVALVDEHIGQQAYTIYNSPQLVVFSCNEELLLAHTAYSVFARMKSTAIANTEVSPWIDMQLTRAKEMIAIEQRDEDMHRRSTRPAGQGIVYTVGDTYLP